VLQQQFDSSVFALLQEARAIIVSVATPAAAVAKAFQKTYSFFHSGTTKESLVTNETIKGNKP